ncbi:MAG: DUF3782 domain-containing protein [Rhodocyclaceae bacterium]|nr:DUF3782 domain-containing protein [Rhodocyclaceae bacterium]
MATATEISWEDLKAMIFAHSEQLRETGELIRELRESSKETDRRLQEAGELIRELRESSKETDRRMRETDRRLRELGEQIGGLGNKFGHFTEGLALPSLERILTERFGMENTSTRHRVRRGEREQEYDVLAWANGDVNLAIIVEVKSRVERAAIEQLVKQLEELPELMPELSGKGRIGILAGVEWLPGVAEEAQSLGLMTATIHDEIFDLTVPEGFEPRRW